MTTVLLKNNDYKHNDRQKLMSIRYLPCGLIFFYFCQIGSLRLKTKTIANTLLDAVYWAALFQPQDGDSTPLLNIDCLIQIYICVELLHMSCYTQNFLFSFFFIKKRKSGVYSSPFTWKPSSKNTMTTNALKGNLISK